jgi:hypothetical protein
LFLGNSSLFDGLYIKEKAKWDFEAEKRPVIHLSMSNLGSSSTASSSKGMMLRLTVRLSKIGKRAGISIPESMTLEDQFSHLIEELYDLHNKQVVVIIDEYDAPLLDLVNKPSEQAIMRNFLATFYGQLKDLDQYLRLVYITGILKFSSMSLFSKLNNIFDHSFVPSTATLCGYTEDEIKSTFGPHLERYRIKFKLETISSTIGFLRERFNGYCFGIDEGVSSVLSPQVYNPFAINHALAKANAADEWTRSGHSSFLVQRIMECKAADKALTKASKSLDVLQQSCTPDNLPYDSLMYFAGYSTIKSYDHETNTVILGPPNESIRTDLLPQIIEALARDVINEDLALVRQLVNALFGGKAKEKDLQLLLNEVLAKVPYQLLSDTKALESTYNVFFSTIFRFGCSRPVKYLGGEVSFSLGRLELAIENMETRAVVIVEFKLKASTKEALDGIIERKHYLLYPNRKLILVGVNIAKDRVVEAEVNDSFVVGGKI